jgi:hypothetical protein
VTQNSIGEGKVLVVSMTGGRDPEGCSDVDRSEK